MAVLPRVQLTDEQRAEVRRRVLKFLEDRRSPVMLITTGLDGKPKLRLMGAWNDGDFTMYMVSRRPTHKLEEFRRNPEVILDWMRYDCSDPDIDQPIRHVAITGTVELVLDAPSMRALPHYEKTVNIPVKPSDPPNKVRMDSEDRFIEEQRFCFIVHPKIIRAEGFVPGPRYPVYLQP